MHGEVTLEQGLTCMLVVTSDIVGLLKNFVVILDLILLDDLKKLCCDCDIAGLLKTLFC